MNEYIYIYSLKSVDKVASFPKLLFILLYLYQLPVNNESAVLYAVKSILSLHSSSKKLKLTIIIILWSGNRSQKKGV